MQFSGSPKYRFRLAVAALLVACGFGIVWAERLMRPLWYLPDPAQADAESLLHWVALRDLDEQPREVQVALVNRLQQEVDPRAFEETSPSHDQHIERYAERIRNNAELLKKVWFETRCQEYGERDLQQRYTFLSQQLQTVIRWSRVLDHRAAHRSQAQPSSDSHPAVARFFAQVEAWIDQASPTLQAQMRRTVRDAMVCWLSSNDLNDMSPATRRYMAQKIAQQLAREQQTPSEPLPLPPKERSQLRQNAMLLVEAWVNWQAECYANLATEKRQAMVDACLDQVQSWRLDRFLHEESGHQPSNLWTQLAAHLPLWLERGEPAERKRLQAFMAHLQQRFLWRSLQHFSVPAPATIAPATIAP